jgi:Zn ribbon nucleic-acid-binding protein
MKSLKRENNIRAVITLADDERHVGSIYQVCNFKYYGLSDPKSDFYRASDGKGNPRCTTKDKQGVWVQRTRKHRYCFILDKKIKCLYDEVKEKPKQNLETTSKYSCCNGTEVIHDNRFNETWKCPKCTTNGAMRLVNNENSTFNKDKPIGNWFG